MACVGHTPVARSAKNMRPAHVPQTGLSAAVKDRSSGMRPHRSAMSAIVVLSPPADVEANCVSGEVNDRDPHVPRAPPAFVQISCVADHVCTCRTAARAGCLTPYRDVGPVQFLASRIKTGGGSSAMLAPGMMSPETVASCSFVRTSTGSTPGNLLRADICSLKEPCSAKTPIFTAAMM